MDTQETLEEFWAKKPELIRHFLAERHKFQRLTTEVAYALQRKLSSSSIEIASIPQRTKSLESFVEKVRRKRYRNPMKQMTDISAVRIVYLYRGDLEEIESIITLLFDVHERVDKAAELGDERFGYGAVHMIVSLGQKYEGPRYEELKGRRAEIQVRTVLQDAWAIIDHHLKYKSVAATPGVIKRGLTALAAVFENADIQFDSLHNTQEEYRNQVKASISDKERFLLREVDLETLTSYLINIIGDTQVAESEAHLARIIARMKALGYKRIGDVKELLDQTEAIRSRFRERFPTTFSVGEIVLALAVQHPEYRTVGLLPAKRQFLRRLESNAGTVRDDTNARLGVESAVQLRGS